VSTPPDFQIRRQSPHFPSWQRQTTVEEAISTECELWASLILLHTSNC
jgi:hypothetical protein